MKALRLSLAALCIAIALLLGAGPAAAHLTPNSEISLEMGAANIRADIIIPQGEYAVATGNPVGNDAASLATARSYIADRFAVTTPGGQPWTVHIQSAEFAQIAGPPDLHAIAILTPPTGAPIRKFAIHWTAVVQELPSHFALFIIRSDIAGVSGTEPIVAGAARAASPDVAIDTGDASRWHELGNAIRLGVDHIIGGYDHLMFLLALLLPAPLIARAGRWREGRGTRATLWGMASVVTAFTVGHSVTLVGATLGGWQLPVQPVEVAIAISVLVSAAHAVRPIFPGYEPFIAGGFGLIHGLAFATLVAGLHLGTTTAPLALLGFNLGIELVQLGIVLVTLPALVLLARRPLYTPVRITLACFGMTAALAWIVNRLFDVGAPVVAAIESAMGWLAIAVACLSIATILTTLVRRQRAQPGALVESV